MRNSSSFIIILLLLACHAATAQQDNKKEVIRELNGLMARYQSADHLSFSINYKYAMEDKPSFFLDSMQGQFKMHGSLYSYSIDNTESIVGSDYSIMLFKEDQVMYLSKPAANAQTGNPLAMPDTTYLASNDVTCSIAETKGEKRISLEFKPGGGCRRIDYYIDKKTGYVTRMVSLVHSSQLYDESVRSAVEGNAYAIVEMQFGNYRQKSFDDTELDTSKYFTKEGKEFVTTASYKSYKIFLGTPNL